MRIVWWAFINHLLKTAQEQSSIKLKKGGNTSYPMVSYYIVPPWFFGYDVLFEFIFAVITLIVGIYAFRVYKLSQQEQPKFFSIAFLLVSVSYFAKSVFNFMVINALNGPASVFLRLNNVAAFNTLGMLLHILFFISGISLLVYMMLKIKSLKAYFLLTTTLCLSLIFNDDRGYVFYVLTSLLFIYLCWLYLANYIKNKQHRTLLVLSAFICLLIGHATYIFAETQPLPYVIGHFLELAAYLLILLNLILIVRKVRK